MFTKADMTDLSAIDYKENVRRVIRRRLKELGIKVPKSKAGRHEKFNVSMSRRFFSLQARVFHVLDQSVCLLTHTTTLFGLKASQV